MKFEELESLWSAQTSVIPVAVDLADIKRQLEPEMRRRSRMLAYELGMNLLAVLLIPVLAVANYRYDPVHYGASWQWVHVACQIAVAVLLLQHAWRRLGRHRTLGRRPVGTLRGMTLVSVASLEAEMRDYRVRQPILALVLTSTTAAIVSAGLLHGWRLALASGLGTAGLAGIVALVSWRHYRANLHPAWVRQTQLLRALE